MGLLRKILRVEKEIENKVDTAVSRTLQKHKLIPIDDTSEGDIFLAGFPKSGNTWLQNLVAGVLLHSDSPYLTLKLVSELIPDVHAKQYYMRFFNHCIFKTHGLPEKKHQRVIYIVRDGRDAMVSYYNMGKNKFKDFPHTMDDMIVKGNGVFPCKWNEHIQSWLSNPHNADILYIRYEDLHTKPMEEMRKVSDFIGVAIEDQKLASIIENNQIDVLRNRAGTFGMDNDHTWKHKPITTFFRKGNIGGYQTEMPDHLISYFNKECEDPLIHFNYI